MRTILFLSFFIAISLLPAQAATVRVYGTVTDSCGVSIPRATVMFIAGKDTTTTLSDSLGNYEVFLSNSPVGIKETPSAFSLSQNYPNPFNPSTTIQFSLDKQSMVTLDVYSITGQHVRTLVNEYEQPGTHHVVWDGRDVNGMNAGSGVYLYRLRAGEQVAVKKMLLMEGGISGTLASKLSNSMLAADIRNYWVVAEKIGASYAHGIYSPNLFAMNVYQHTVSVDFAYPKEDKHYNIGFSDKYEPYMLLFDSGQFRQEFAYPGDSLRVVLVGKHESILPNNAHVSLVSQSGDREFIILADSSDYSRRSFLYDCIGSTHYPESKQKTIATTISTAISNNGAIDLSFPSDSLIAIYYYDWGDSATASIAIADSIECFDYAEYWNIEYIRWRDIWYFWDYNIDQTARIFYTPSNYVFVSFYSTVESDAIQDMLDDLSFSSKTHPLTSMPTLYACYWEDERSVTDILNQISEKYNEFIDRVTPVTHGCGE